MSKKSQLIDAFTRTMYNCRFYESEHNDISLNNEIGVLRGLYYALEIYDISLEKRAYSEFLHFIDMQQFFKNT